MLILPEIILTITGIVLILLDLGLAEDRKGAVPAVAGIGFLAALVGLGPSVGQNIQVLWQMYSIDSVSLFFRTLFLAVGFMAVLVSWEYARRTKMAIGEFYHLLVFTTLGMMLMASTHNLIVIYLGLELSSISSYVMAGMLQDEPRSGEAALKYFLIGSVASAIALFGMSLVYGLTGTTDIVDALGRLQLAPPALVVTAGLFLLAGFGLKVGMVPFHMWIPDTYQGAPTPVTAFFSVGPKAAAMAAILRIFVLSFLGLPALGAGWRLMIAVLAAISMTFGNVTALLQTNVKRMLAYSSIAHVGYMLVGIAALPPRDLSAVLTYLAAYAIMNLGIFAVVILVEDQGQAPEIDAFRGLAYRAPWAAVAMAVFFLSLVGVPPTIGFFAKLQLFLAAVDAHMVWLGVILGINSAISVGYYYSVVKVSFLRDAEGVPPVRAAWTIGAAVVLLAVGTLVAGIYSDTILRWTASGVTLLMR